jgi:DHA2 family multidrug resistance protein
MAIYYHVRGVGSVLGVGATGAMLDIRESVHSSRLLDLAGRLNPDIHRLQVGLGHALHARGLPATTANLGSYEIFHGLVTKQTLTLAYIDIFWCFQMLALAGIVLVLVLWPNARRAASTVVRRVFTLAFNGVRRSPAVASSQ